MHFFVIYIDPEDEDEKGMVVQAPNERLAMRAVFGEIVQVSRIEENDLEDMEDEWNLY